ncbi:metal-dependent hydrolase [Methanolobus bombayensis]|uniref:metal-dependent hydrolase n=1 Tax=Methanolobus bombayensis TaxID=38023 RepID=UPI001AEB32A6|nr:metal-dependent hydrolase [Methanolobus bombayensis]MBP1909632.1 fructose-specific phosphotransferase system IIC component [Methanolobus bombayensis]
MPFTPFHLGPIFLLGEIFEKKVNLFSILIGSIIIDIRATYCLFAGCRPLHGPLHTFLAATIVGLLIAWLIYSQRTWLQKITDKLRIEQSYSFNSTILGSIIGTWSHVVLDSPLYSEITPLWPSTSNPLLWEISSVTIYALCAVSFLPATIIFIYRYWKRDSKSQK